MIHTIIFTENTSWQATNERNYNLLYLQTQERYINDLLKRRGYVYLNQIYEILGVVWDCNSNNSCCIYEKSPYIEFNVIDRDDGGCTIYFNIP